MSARVCSLPHMRVWKVLIVLCVLATRRVQVTLRGMCACNINNYNFAATTCQSVSCKGARHFVEWRLAPTKNGGYHPVPPTGHFSPCFGAFMPIYRPGELARSWTTPIIIKCCLQDDFEYSQVRSQVHTSSLASTLYLRVFACITLTSLHMRVVYSILASLAHTRLRHSQVTLHVTWVIHTRL